MVLELAVICAFPWAMAAGGAMDLFTLRIPNQISIFMTVSFFVLAPLSGMDLTVLVNHSGAGAAMLVLGIFMFAMGWLGGGDAKLFAASALWVGFDQLLEFVVYLTLAGGALTLSLVFYRVSLPHPWLLRFPWALRLHDPVTGVPYGVALAAAALIVFPTMPWIAALGGPLIR